MKENYFSGLQEQILNNPDTVLFNVKKISEITRSEIEKALEKQPKTTRGLFFERIVCDFFDFLGFKVTRTKKTRDFGIDGIIKAEVAPFGSLKMGLQVKYKTINSRDVDAFVQALNFAEIRIGLIVCKNTKRLDKYTLSSKLKALLAGSGHCVELNERIDLKPVFVMNLNEIIDIFSKHTRGIVRSIYKR